jgi:hypothetical protein
MKSCHARGNGGRPIPLPFPAGDWQSDQGGVENPKEGPKGTIKYMVKDGQLRASENRRLLDIDIFYI